MADAPRNWARASRLWFPISMLPRGGPPVVLANEDKTVQWFSDKPNASAIKHERHARDEEGRFKYRPRKDQGEEQSPVLETTTIKPAWFTPAVYVDDRGEPVHG